MSFVLYALAGALNLFWVAREDVLPVRIQILIPILTAAIVAAGVLLQTRGMPRERRQACIRRGLWVLLIYYLAIVSAMLFFGGLFHVRRGGSGAVNLEPLRTIRNFLIHYRRTGSASSLSNLLGNLVILIPLGVLLPVMFRPMRHFWTFLPLAAALAVGVECIQWATGTGVADIDDSILNFAGAAVGYFITRLVQMVWDAGQRRRLN